jgi:hypothetical protein
MKSTVKSIAIPVSLFLLAFIVGGCSSTTTPSTNSPHSAGVGTTFTYTFYQVDSSGALIKPADGTMQVLATAIAYQGKTNVTQYENVDGKMQFVNYESNGNYSIYHKNHWEEAPVGTKGETVTYWYDTSATDDINKHKLALTYAGTEDVTLAGQTFHTTKIIAQDQTWTNGTLDEYQPPAEISWIAPEIAWYVKIRIPAEKRYGNWYSGTAIDLKSYSLK